MQQLESDAARRYVARLESAGEADLVAAVFILWGPLVIGGACLVATLIYQPRALGAC